MMENKEGLNSGVTFSFYGGHYLVTVKKLLNNQYQSTVIEMENCFGNLYVE